MTACGSGREDGIVRIGAVLPQGEFGNPRFDEVLAFVKAVEAAGCDHLMLFDHVIGANAEERPGWRGAYDHRNPFLEPLVLSALLVNECALELVTDVLVLPQRQTALVAKQVATLEALVPGRIRLGVGIGWNDVEYDALGMDFRRRARRLEEQVPLLRRWWSEKWFSHSGDYDRVDRAGIAPRPPRVPPIWIGSGDNPRALARVGRLADGWIPMPVLQPGRGFEPAWDAVTAAAAEAGRTERLGLQGHVWVRDDNLRDVPRLIEAWQEAGADAVALNTLRRKVSWPDGHLDLLLRALDSIR